MKHLCGKTIKLYKENDECITENGWCIASWMCKGDKF